MDKEKKRKPYYNTDKSKRGRFTERKKIEPGLKGFLCSCNNSQEKYCIKESYNLLNKYADELYKSVDDQQAPDSTASTTDQLEIADELASEIKNIRTVRHRFEHINCGVQNLVFINTILDDPVKLARTIVEEIQVKNVSQARYIVRLVPIQTTCKAHVDDIVLNLKPLLSVHLLPGQTFSIIFNHRLNDKLKRQEVIEKVADTVAEVGTNNDVNLKNPDVCILIEAIKGMAYMSLIPDYIKLKKFNITVNQTKSDEKDSQAVDETLEEKLSLDEDNSQIKSEIPNVD